MDSADRPIAVPRSPAAAAPVARVERESLRLMIGLSFGHAVKHFYQQGLLLLLPYMQVGLLLSDAAVGGIYGARTAASGAMNVPAGVLADMFRRRVALMLAASMGCLAVGYLFVGISPFYWLILVGVTIGGAGTSMWHAPAFGTLAARYPDRRAFAMAAHRSGGSLGDTTAPLAVGALLGGISFWGLNWGGFDWRTVALLHVPPAAVTGLIILATFKSGGVGAPARVTFAEYLAATRPLLRNATVLSMVTLEAVVRMASQSLLVFLVLYMALQLGYSSFVVGYHIALLALAGIVSGPIFGAISDRTRNRRTVIVLGLLVTTLLIFSLTWATSGWPLTVAVALLGVVMRAVDPVITATAMDAIDRGTEGSAIAMLFTGGAIIGAVAPVIAGVINTEFAFQGVVVFATALTAIATALALVVPMKAKGILSP